MSTEHVSSLRTFNSILRESSPQLVVVDFHATWCGPCVAIAPFYESLSKKYVNRVRFLKVDVDEAEDIAQQCSISAMPTFQFYLDNNLVYKFSGADQSKLVNNIEKYAPSNQQVSFKGHGMRLGVASSSSSVGSSSNDIEYRRAEAVKAATERRLRKEEIRKQQMLEEEEEKEKEMNEERYKANPILLNRLVYEMGFPKIRAEKALILTNNQSVEQAVDWCFDHADDIDIDKPLQFNNIDSNVSSQTRQNLSTQQVKQKADDLYTRARTKREEEEKQNQIQREKERIRSSKQVNLAKEKYEADERKRAVEEKLREKRIAAEERERVKQMLEADKLSRRERFRMPSQQQHTQPLYPQQQQQQQPLAMMPNFAQSGLSFGKVLLRLPDGSRIEGEFDGDQKLQDVVKFLVNRRPELVGRNLLLVQQYPRRSFGIQQYQITLKELGLLPRGALSVSFA